jgi:transketolase
VQWDLARVEASEDWDAELPSWEVDATGVATREAGGKAMNAIAQHVPWFMGGDADLAPSTKNNLIKFGDFEAGNRGGRNIHFGVRENAMGSIVNGITVNGFLRAFGATFSRSRTTNGLPCGWRPSCACRLFSVYPRQRFAG